MSVKTQAVETAVILCAGLGSRFLPITKAIPKAMLPIIDKPIIHYLVEEAVSSGINNIIIVMSPGMESVKAYFERNQVLEDQLKEKGKYELLDKINFFQDVNFEYIVQHEALGDGHAILQAKEFLAGKPFAVLFGDEIIANQIPALKQLISVYESSGEPVIASKKVDSSKTHLYGILDPQEIIEKTILIKGLIEKPEPAEAPSNFGIIGKYICTPEVLEHLQKNLKSKDGEQRLIEAFVSMLEAGFQIKALEIEGKRFDTGSKEGLLEANKYFS